MSKRQQEREETGRANLGPRPLYFDYQATTPVDPRVVEAMLPFFNEKFGNPHSVNHAFGWEAEEAVEVARAEVATLIGAEPREIIFTSGATEANNLAIKGAARFHREAKPQVVTAASEHKCVLESCRRLEEEGSTVTVLPVDGGGLIDLAELEAALQEPTAVVSIMAVNNEIGVIQPLAEIGALCRAAGAYFHTDAAQAFGKIPLDVGAMNIDLMSISGHKIYGPKGVGALYIRRRPRVRLEPLFDGGGQERGLRSGTLAPMLCVGLGVASAVAREGMAEETEHLQALNARLRESLDRRLGGVHLNGDPERRIPGCLNLAFDGIDAEDLLRALPELALSTGSACTSATVESSYVLRALGLDEDRARSSLRIGIGRFTTAAEIDRAVALIAERVERLRGEHAAE